MTNTKVPMIVEGNAFKGIVPLYYAMSGTKVPLDAALISNLTIRISKSGAEVPDIPFVTAEHRVIIGFNDELAKGAYSVEILGDIESLGLRYAKKLGFQIVGWNEQSNFDGLVCGMDVPLEDALFILSATDGEIEELEERLRQAIAEAQTAKEEWVRKAEMLDDVASETNATANKNEIIQEVRTAQPDLSSVAKEATLQGVSDKVGTFTNPTETVAHKLENLTFDKTDLAKEATTAKQGSNPNVSLTTMDEKLGNIVMMTDEEFQPALEDLETHLN